MAMVADRSEAWVQTSPTRDPQHDLHQEHALLGMTALSALGLHFDYEHRGLHTVRMGIVNRKDDTFG